MSKLYYCFEQYKSPNAHPINKRIWYDMIGSIPHQNFYFYHFPTRGRVGVKLGDADTSPTYLQFLLVPCCYIINLGCFIIILYHFLVLTYWHSAKCQLLFSTCFLHRMKSISDGVQTQRNFTEIFLDQKERNGPWLCLGGAPREAQPTRGRQEAQACPGGCAHLGCPQTASLLYK